MNIHPDLRALRSDDSPQRDAQAALFETVGAWRREPQVARMLAELDAFAEQGSDADCPTLAALFDNDGNEGEEFASSFVQTVCACLEGAPLGHVPLRHFTDGTISTLMLARSANATLSLIAIDGDGLAARPDPVTVDFSPSEVWERVLAGKGSADRIERVFTGDSHALIVSHRIKLFRGARIARDATREALQVRAVDGCLVTLRLQRRRPEAGPTREYRLSDGQLVHQAAGNPRDSRIELMMALLGRMGRSDAAAVLSDIAREAGSTALRWQALRECLALDTGEGFAALTALATSHDDDLAPAAGALRSQLIEAYPQLVEAVSCPAHTT